MKRIILSLLLAVALAFSPVVGSLDLTSTALAKTAYHRTALTGNTAASLDGIDGAGLADGDFAFVMAGSVLYTYILDDDSGAAESSPSVISPDSNAGTKRWILQSPPPASTSAAGIVELATDAETSAGTDTERAVTPAGLASVYQYQTLYIPASAMTPATTNGAAAGTAETSSNKLNMDYLAFDTTTEEMAHFSVVMPKGWDRGTVKFVFRWTSATGSTAGDTVEWEVAGVAISNDDALDAALGTSQVISDTLLADNGADLQVTGATPALTIGGTPALGDTIHFVISRNVGGTDDMAEDAWLLGATLEYKLTETVTAD
jgi:hypothetical protein